MNHLVIGVVLVAIAIFLALVGRPNRAGQHPRFLRFDSSLVLYPPIILIVFAMGSAEIITALLGISR